MQPLLNQELARIRYAETLREASRRHAVVRDREPQPQPVDERVRARPTLLARFRPALRLG